MPPYPTSGHRPAPRSDTRTAEETLGELRGAVQRLDPTQLLEFLSTDYGELREFVIAALDQS